VTGGGLLLGLKRFPNMFQFPGGAGVDSADDVPPPDAMRSIRIRQHIDDVFLYATRPGSWPHWHLGSEMVSGEIDADAEAGNRAREHLGAEFGLDAAREVQWTVHTVRQPRYSMDGDGAFHAVGYDVRDPDWRVEIRCGSCRRRGTAAACASHGPCLHTCPATGMRCDRCGGMHSSRTSARYCTGTGSGGMLRH
jgi:hypothetical protein